MKDIIWSKIVRSYQTDRLFSSKILIKFFILIWGGGPLERALDATLDVLLRNSPLAVAKFKLISSYLEGSDSDDLKYIKEYSNLYVCLIEKGRNCEGLRKKAISLNPDPKIRRWLVIPDCEIVDPR